MFLVDLVVDALVPGHKGVCSQRHYKLIVSQIEQLEVEEAMDKFIVVRYTCLELEFFQFCPCIDIIMGMVDDFSLPYV